MVIAFCSRGNLVGSLAAIANGFAEITPSVFTPGASLRASSLLQLMKNIREAACSCEFFGPATYHNGNTVPLPTSPIDGYAYTRDEITVLWEWSDTTNQSGVHLRVPGFWGDVSQTTGVVTTRVWRLPPGGPYVEDGDIYPTINAMVVAQRGAQHPALSVTNANPASDSGTATVDNNPPDNAIYAIAYYAGQINAPAASEQILTHAISGQLNTVTLPSGLPGSFGGCITAPTGTVTFTLQRVPAGSTTPATIGTMVIAAAAKTATFTFTADLVCNPGDLILAIAPSSSDATLKGVYFTLVGIRQ
jgi:hypothetical protein